MFNNKNLEKKIEEIWEEIKEKFAEKGRLDKKKELEDYRNELIKHVDENEKVALGIQLDDLFGKQEKFVLVKEGGRNNRFFEKYENELDEARKKVAEKIGKKEVSEFCNKVIHLVELGNFEHEKKPVSKLMAIKSILDSYREENKEIKRLKVKIKELEEEYHQKTEEEKIQKEIVKILKKLKTSGELPEKELEELEKKLNNIKGKQIDKRATDFLKVKENYLEIHLKIAKKLQECCEVSDKNNINYQKRKTIIKGMSDVLGIIAVPVKAVNINLSKLVDVIGDVNDYYEISSRIESSKEFKTKLENDQNNWSSFEKSFNSLREVLNKNRELAISCWIIDDLKLEDKEGSAKPLKTFEVRYEKVCNIAENWKKEYSDIKEMKGKVDSIVKILSDLNLELSEEKNRIKSVENKLSEMLETKIEQPLKQQ